MRLRPARITSVGIAANSRNISSDTRPGVVTKLPRYSRRDNPRTQTTPANSAGANIPSATRRIEIVEPSIRGTLKRRITQRAATIIAISMMTASTNIAVVRRNEAPPRVRGSVLRSIQPQRRLGNRPRLPSAFAFADSGCAPTGRSTIRSSWTGSVSSNPWCCYPKSINPTAATMTNSNAPVTSAPRIANSRERMGATAPQKPHEMNMLRTNPARRKPAVGAGPDLFGE